MTKVTLYLEPAVALFYSRVADWQDCRWSRCSATAFTSWRES